MTLEEENNEKVDQLVEEVQIIRKEITSPSNTKLAVSSIFLTLFGTVVWYSRHSLIKMIVGKVKR